METGNARGTRDVSGADAILRQRTLNALRTIFELHGYGPLETPSLERYDVLTSKYAGGEEILKEMFRLKDQGNRDLALRFDLTVPLARFIASNPNLKMPFKRYAIGSVYRDGPLKAGRYREFAQCDADAVGDPTTKADAEFVRMALRAFEKLGLDVVVKVNSRKVLDAVLEKAGVGSEKAESAILSIDKLAKIGREGVEKELKRKGIEDAAIGRLMECISVSGSNGEKLAELKKTIGGIADEVEQVLELADSENAEFDPSLARGLAYYTGTVFEAFLRDSEIKSSVAAGGRYDKMIGNFVGNNREYPAVGISFGLDVIADALKAKKPAAESSVTRALVVSIGEDKKAMQAAEKLREKGVNTDADLTGKVGRAVEYANSYGIPFVVFVGKKEAAEGKVKIKDMKTGDEKIVAADGLSGEDFQS